MNIVNLINPIAALLSFCLGFLSGYLMHKVVDKVDADDNSSLVLIVVTLVWTLSMVVDIISLTYETSPLLHGLMGAIVGFYYKKGNQHERTS